MTRSVGTPVDRVDGPAKVTGQARYAADQLVDNLAHGVLVQSGIARGRIGRIDTAAAENAAGVLAVVTHHNAPRLHQPRPQFGVGQTYLPVQEDVIHYSGQHIAVVVAETLEQARDAAELIEVDYRTEQPVVRLADGEPFVPPGSEWGYTRGDAGEAIDAAPVRVEIEVASAMYHHHPIEPLATIAVWEGERLTLYESTQGVRVTQSIVSETLGIPAENVRVIAPFLGGGFGCKGFSWPHTVLTAVAARMAERPVKLVLTRAQTFSSNGHRGEATQRMRLGAGTDGRLTGIEHVLASQTSPFDDRRSIIVNATESLYACPNVQVTERLVRLNINNPAPIRAPGAPSLHVLETALDDLADRIGIDPIELRLRNYADEDPLTGQPWHQGAKFLRDCYAIGAEQFGWQRRNPRPGSMRQGETRIGWGMATACHDFFAVDAEAQVALSPDGRALLQSGTQDIGTGTSTVMTQVAADALGMPLSSIRFELGDTALPRAPQSTGSATVCSVTGAVHGAGTDARDQVIRIAIADPRSPLHGLDPEQVSVSDGRLYRTDSPGQGETYQQVLARHGEPIQARSSSGANGSGLTYGALFAEVRVDPDIGRIRVHRIVGAFDAGRVINPKTASSQISGGIIWGLGMTLMEHTGVDRNLGRIVTSSLSTALVPVEADVPDIEVHFVNKPDSAGTAFGARGIGEVGGTGISAAIANAVHHATGRRIHRLPITPDTLL